MRPVGRSETTILNFRHLLEWHHLGEGVLAEITQHLAAQGLRLREGTIVDATILDAAGVDEEPRPVSATRRCTRW